MNWRPQNVGISAGRNRGMMRIRSIVLDGLLAMALCLGFAIGDAEGRRSSQWEPTRAAHIQAQGWCALCGTSKDLEVHHLTPVHIAPELELDPANLITLCRHCHFEAGHLGNWTNDVAGLRVVIGEVGATLHRMRLMKDAAQPVGK